MKGLDAYLAANRFGLGGRQQDLADMGSDPRGWLRQQLATPSALPPPLAGLPGSAENLLKFYDAQRINAAEIQKLFRTEYKQTLFQEIHARTATMVKSRTPFRERLVMFWSNHFTVSATRPIVAGLVGAFEREAIRPHVGGRFADLLLAVTKHPAMILYLDNALSIGPKSVAGRFLDRGLNENLAREILELHTLGVDGGYTQHDVLALAKLITGWSLARPGRQPNPGRFHFHARAHEPGAKTLLGKVYDEGGISEGEAALVDLARHPSTARHIALKLARHFVADEPPPALVTDLANIFTESDGDLTAVTAALIDRPEPWQTPHAKYKTPNEFVLSVLRAVGFGGNANQLVGSLNELGQVPFTAPSPAGWPDTAAAWAGPEAVVRRAEWSLAVGQRVGAGANPLRLMETTLGPLASDRTRETVARAESPSRGLALLLASPEFQRR